MAGEIIGLDAVICGAAGVVGKKEHEGPLGGYFDMYDGTDAFGTDTWEKAEGEMQRRALALAMKKASVKEDGIGSLFAGDLLNQCVGSAYGLLDFNIPYFGLYGACSTAAEGLLLASVMVSKGIHAHSAAVTSSHYCSAERQYRTPLEYGSQRPPTAQWTVTGAGAFIVGDGSCDGKVKVTEALPGIVVEKGICDANNMGAAMAPAALSTLLRYFDGSGLSPEDFDMIITGDLGYEGGAMLTDLARAEGLDISGVYNDCGMMIFNRAMQDVHAGGSGCGCSAVVMADYIIPRLAEGKLGNILFLGTGAMMSPASLQQGCAIPAVAHLIRLESRVK